MSEQWRGYRHDQLQLCGQQRISRDDAHGQKGRVDRTAMPLQFTTAPRIPSQRSPGLVILQ